ncbi:MAG TPA: glycosyltransferase family 1 protein [Gemmatimonadaceae bacterium]|nr:glycosyltransferase family 1 protein [Gemmatimonadaceae bacterium]
MTGLSPTEGKGSAAGLRLAIFTDTYPPQINGVAPTLARLVKAVEARGGDVQVVTVSDPDAIADAQVERWPSIPFWAYPQLQMAAPRRDKALDLIEKWKPNLIHSTTEFGVGLGGLFAAREKRVPFVTSYHTHFTAYLRHYKLTVLDAIGWPYLRWFHNAGRITWAPSEIVRAELAANAFENTRVWSRGVDPNQFHPRFRSNELRKQLGVAEDGVLAVYVGRIAPEKGIHVALEGMRQVMERNGKKVSFALAGHGPDEERCRATAPPGTVFMGRLTGRSLSEFYASADIFVFPSITETFGNVVLEAMSSRLALVAPDWGATTELATTETALQFPAHDAAALAERVERLVNDPALRKKISDAAFAVATTRTWDAVFDRLVGDYRDALNA